MKGIIIISLIILNMSGIAQETDWDETSLKNHWEQNGIDKLEGIYEKVGNRYGASDYQLGLKKTKKGYILIFLSCSSKIAWQVGKIKAYLTSTANPSLFKTIWIFNKNDPYNNVYVKFQDETMKVVWTDGKPTDFYLKIYPINY